MTLRPGTVDDVPGVLPLVGKISALHKSWDVARFNFKDNIEELYRGWLTKRVDDPRSVFLVAERDSEIVAYVVGTVEPEIPIFWVPECGWIHDIWVEPEYRNEGVARQLVMLSIEKFKQIGVKQVRLHTAAANDVGRELFKSCGFRPCVVEMLAEI